jgi:Kef-type K+ transport system membrane component KefB
VEVYELLSVGVVILIGLLGGTFSHRIKIPKVTGYMITGLVFGPSVLGFLSSQTLQDIHMINDIALGLILFAIGGEFEINHLRSLKSRVLLIALAESFAAMIMVFTTTLLISGDPGLAMLLGSISMATAPGVTLLVIREYRARGDVTETLLAVVALNNVICLLMFRLSFAFYSLAEGVTVTAVALELLKELAGSLVIGIGIGAMITYWEQKIDDLSELLLIIIGGLLVGIGLSVTLGISHLAVSLIIGAVTNNLSMMHRLVYAELRQTEMPFYIAFFVLSGASLHLDSLYHLGFLGLAYLLSRPVGKWVGSYLAGRRLNAGPAITRYLGPALIPQAGVAIGMFITVSETHPEMGQIIGTVILSSVIVYEGIGPFMTRLALVKANEINPED